MSAVITPMLKAAMVELNERFPKGTKVGKYKVVGKETTLLDDNRLYLRVLKDGRSFSEWVDVVTLKKVETYYKNKEAKEEE